MNSRQHKLTAIVRDPSAAPAERAFAQRMLDEMAAQGSTTGATGATFALREGWELALLDLLVERHKLTIVWTSELPVVDGDPDDLDKMISDLVQLHPALDAVVVSATAGFLAAHFPATTPEVAGVHDPILAAAFQAGLGAAQGAAPKRLTGVQRLFAPVHEATKRRVF